MPATRASLRDDLRKLGLSAGQIVLVHASVRAVGPVLGGPDELHFAVTDIVASGGAMMMYVGCQEGFDDVGRGILSPEEEAEMLEGQPAFDFQNSRASRDHGVLAEFFRSTPGTLCSRNVGARMGARGERADWLVADHPWNYGYGAGSPLEKLCVTGGSILLVGAVRDEVTLLHYAEHIAPIADKRVIRYRAPILANGRRSWVECEEFDTSSIGVHPNWPLDAFAQIVNDFVTSASGTPACRRGRVGRAESVLLDAGSLVDHAVPIMLAWAKSGTPILRFPPKH
jgi:aminoglycoside 3-N-acetyltransferase